MSAFRNHLGGQILVTFLPEMTGPGLGLYDSMAEHSETAWWGRIKSDLAACHVPAKETDVGGKVLLRLLQMSADLHFVDANEEFARRGG